MSTQADRMADRIIARATGQGDDPGIVRSTAGNPFLSKPRKVDAERAAITIRPNAKTDFETARPLLGKRVARVIAGQYDVELHFTDGTALMLSMGGTGLEFLVTQTTKEAKP